MRGAPRGRVPRPNRGVCGGGPTARLGAMTAAGPPGNPDEAAARPRLFTKAGAERRGSLSAPTGSRAGGAQGRPERPPRPGLRLPGASRSSAPATSLALQMPPRGRSAPAALGPRHLCASSGSPSLPERTPLPEPLAASGRAAIAPVGLQSRPDPEAGERASCKGASPPRRSSDAPSRASGARRVCPFLTPGRRPLVCGRAHPHPLRGAPGSPADGAASAWLRATRPPRPGQQSARPRARPPQEGRGSRGRCCPLSSPGRHVPGCAPLSRATLHSDARSTAPAGHRPPRPPRGAPSHPLQPPPAGDWPADVHARRADGNRRRHCPNSPVIAAPSGTRGGPAPVLGDRAESCESRQLGQGLTAHKLSSRATGVALPTRHHPAVPIPHRPLHVHGTGVRTGCALTGLATLVAPNGQ